MARVHLALHPTHTAAMTTTNRVSRPDVALSQDRRTATLTYPTGQTVTYTSDHDGGFTDAEVDRMARATPSRMTPGQRSRALRATITGREVFVHVNTGPPTWWTPRVEHTHTPQGGHRVMAGWFRAMVAVVINPATATTKGTSP